MKLTKIEDETLRAAAAFARPDLIEHDWRPGTMRRLVAKGAAEFFRTNETRYGAAYRITDAGRAALDAS